MEKTTTLTILNEEGLHARPAGVLAKTAATFKSQIELQFNGKTINAKSIMSLMSSGMTHKSEFVLKVTGDDAETAIAKISDLINNKFNLH